MSEEESKSVPTDDVRQLMYSKLMVMYEEEFVEFDSFELVFLAQEVTKNFIHIIRLFLNIDNMVQWWIICIIS